MPSDDRRPAAGAVFSKREAILVAAAAMTVAATLTALLSRLTLDDAYITFRYARHLADGYGLGAWNRTGEHATDRYQESSAASTSRINSSGSTASPKAPAARALAAKAARCIAPTVP